MMHVSLPDKYETYIIDKMGEIIGNHFTSYEQYKKRIIDMDPHNNYQLLDLTYAEMLSISLYTSDSYYKVFRYITSLPHDECCSY